MPVRLRKAPIKISNPAYCFQCKNYPCEKYDKIDEYDSFITHQNQKTDMARFREPGAELYLAEQQRKKDLPKHIGL